MTTMGRKLKLVGLAGMGLGCLMTARARATEQTAVAPRTEQHGGGALAQNAPAASAPQDRRLHLVCNAHLDPVWLWEWEEGAAEAISTFRVAADLCEQNPDFIFCHNEVILYEWVEEYEPALFARIQQLVKQGRWHIMGGWFLQPDCNMPAGEAFIRQALAGRRYFDQKFGVRPTTAINFDPFGHARGLVQILAKSGYDSYLICRPDPESLPLPADAFTWVGHDGSEVTVERASMHYNSALGQAHKKVEKYLQANPERSCGTLLWGVGNHGGGPSRQDLKQLGQLIGATGECAVRHSTPERYFADLATTGEMLPRIERSLNPWGVGCYTSQIRIKKNYRLLENMLFSTEKMAVAAAAQGLAAYPRAELAAAQRDLLTAMFHDILPGSSIQPVEEAALRLMAHGQENLSRVRARLFFALARGQKAAKEGEIPILVFNPHPWPVKATVECEFQLQDQNWEPTFTDVSVYQGARALPTQLEKEASNLTLDWRKRVVFSAELAPGVMNRFDARLEVRPAKPQPALKADKRGRIVFQTDELEVVINGATGLIDRYRVAGRDYLAEGALAPLVMRDDEDPWAMHVRGFRKLAGRFRLLDPKASARFSGVKAGELPAVRVIEDGPVRVVVEAVFGYKNSFICQHYILPRQGTALEVQTRVLWGEKDRMLKLSVPTPMSAARLLGQTACGVDELFNNGDEVVSQKWCALVEGEDRALTVINDGVYGADAQGGELRLSLLRSAAYSSHPIHDRPRVPQERYTTRIDQGERLYRFWLQGGAAGERLAHIDREALAVNETPFALSFFPQGGGAAARPKAFVTLSGDEAVQLQALKLAEDGEDVIVRLFEPTGRARTATLAFPLSGLKEKVRLAPFEIKTLRLSAQGGPLRETNLLEE